MMSTLSNAAQFARLRGSLRAKPIGARELEHMGRNSDCLRLLVLTMASIPPAVAMVSVYGEQPSEGQSPFALAHGNRFEDRLFASDAAPIQALYRDAGRSNTDDWVIVDIPARAGGKGADALIRREALTLHFLAQKFAGDAGAPHLLRHPRLIVTIADVPFAIEPDALVAVPDARCYQIIEIKSYADRGGLTAAADLRSACRQAAVGVLALRHAFIRLGLIGADAEALTPAVADLVLHRVGSMQPTLREMTLAGELDSLCRTFTRAGEVPETAEAILGPKRALDDPAALDAFRHHYTEGCREFCALAPRCKREAIAQGELGLLGDAARDLLAPAGTIPRALDLMHV